MPSLYLHIPFCERKCLYCDFYSVASSSMVDAFVDALCREMRMVRLRSSGAAGARHQAPVPTVFLGGGTPSLLSPTHVERIFSVLHDCWNVDPTAEITMEVNPGTVDCDRLRAFRSLGVNRLSIGVQSFDQRALDFLGRIHDVAQGEQCIHDARAAGFDNISIDLIFGIPGQSAEQWDHSLRRGMTMAPDHVSAYSLIVEEHTPLFDLVDSGAVVPLAVELEAALYEHTMGFFADAGFRHYEVSNYCRPGFESRHNLAYWHHDEYLGFGPSAHSFVKSGDGSRGSRWANGADLECYVRSLAEGTLPRTSVEELGPRELINESLFLGLRSDGVNMVLLEKEGAHVLPADLPLLIDGLIADGRATLRDGVLRLTDKGYLVCDEIAARFMPFR